MTLEGTNTYVVAADGGAYVIDPGPADAGHLARGARGGRRATARSRASCSPTRTSITPRRCEAARRAAALGQRRQRRRELGEREPGAARAAPARAAAPRSALSGRPTPGHAADHVCLLLGDGLLLRRPDPRPRARASSRRDGGSLADYLSSLRALRRARARAALPRPRPLDHRPGGEDRRVHRAPARPRAQAARRARRGRALARSAAGPRPGTTSRASCAPPRRSRCRRTSRSSRPRAALDRPSSATDASHGRIESRRARRRAQQAARARRRRRGRRSPPPRRPASGGGSSAGRCRDRGRAARRRDHGAGRDPPRPLGRAAHPRAQHDRRRLVRRRASATARTGSGSSTSTGASPAAGSPRSPATRASPLDRFVRTLGLRRIALREEEALEGELRAALEAYSAGVNAAAEAAPRCRSSSSSCASASSPGARPTP